MSNETRVKCDYCGRIVPRSKAVPIYKWVFGERRKVYICISCAKHRRIPIKETRQRSLKLDMKTRYGIKKKPVIDHEKLVKKIVGP